MDFIKIYPNVLGLETCKALIDLFEQNNSIQASPIISAAGLSIEHQVRRSSGMILTPETAGVHYDALNAAYVQAYQKYQVAYALLKRVTRIANEVFTLVRYKDNSEHYGWHVDGADAGSRYRFVSGVCYLNDVKKGGETEFRIQGKKIKPQAGAILLFPSGWTHEHRGLPPESNPKYIITTWLRFTDYPAL
jgi:hypothetical protein